MGLYKGRRRLGMWKRRRMRRRGVGRRGVDGRATLVRSSLVHLLLRQTGILQGSLEVVGVDRPRMGRQRLHILANGTCRIAVQFHAKVPLQPHPRYLLASTNHPYLLLILLPLYRVHRNQVPI
jgi:hypothetical protein